MERRPGEVDYLTIFKEKCLGKIANNCGMNMNVGEINGVNVRDVHTCKHISTREDIQTCAVIQERCTTGSQVFGQALYTSLGIFLPAYLDALSNHHSSTQTCTKSAPAERSPHIIWRAKGDRWIMGNRSRPQDGELRMSGKGMQEGRDERERALSGIMEERHLSASGSTCGKEGRRGREARMEGWI